MTLRMLVTIAIAIASPVACFAMDQRLAQLAYKIELSWLIFALTGLAAFAIAVLTVSIQALKAALADLVKSLSSE